MAPQGCGPLSAAKLYMFQQGQGMSVNYAEAAEWYRKAAKQGYAEAQHKLGSNMPKVGVFLETIYWHTCG